MTLKLDLRGFSFRNKNDPGAKLTIDVEPPAYEIKFKDSDEYLPMKLNQATGLYEYKTYYEGKSYGQEFYILGDDKVYGDPDSDGMYYFDETNGQEYVTITFDPVTEIINVKGSVGNVLTPDTLTPKTVIAAGNGSGAWLNGVNWNPRKTVNTMTETSDGIWEIEYKNVEANDAYKVKFAVNPFDYNGLWSYCFGLNRVATVKNGEEVTATFNGYDAVVNVEEDDSTVHLKLDLSDFDYKTKQGAKLTITVTPPEEPVTLMGDVNGDNVVDILDAVLVQKYSAAKIVLSADQLLAADMNNDGVIDILDATAIQKRAAK